MTAPEARSALLTGRVSHSRLSPRRHAFAYRVFLFRLDLDELAALDRRLRLFGTRWWKLVRFDPSDFMGLPRDGRPVAARIAALKAAVGAALAERGVSAPLGRIEVVAHVRIAGYVFNPVSFFCAYDTSGRLAGVVADVHNTFGERHAYVLPADDGAPGTWLEKKVFHVSPFFTLDGSYRFRLAFGDDGIDVRIDLLDGGAPVFVSHLAATATPLTDRHLAAALARFQAMTARVIGAIHWEALRLWRRGLPYLPKPAYDPARARGATRP
jgi:DUF1365 family protein